MLVFLSFDMIAEIVSEKSHVGLALGYQIYPLVTSLVGGSGDKDKELL